MKLEDGVKKFLLVLTLFLFGVVLIMNGINSKVRTPIIWIETGPNLEIHEGHVSQKEEIVLVRHGKKTIARVHLSKPVVVAQATQKEEWGYFQFPSIGMAEDDNTLIVSWSMKGDTYKMYGRRSEREMTPMMSKDGGITWFPRDKKYTMKKDNRDPVLKSGGSISIKTPASKDIGLYNNFPKSVGISGKRTFYLMDSLPNDLQGIYVNIREKGRKTQTVHAKLNDPKLLRYSIDSLMPIVWWGNMRQLADSSLVAGIYPGCYLDTPGGVDYSGVSFYKSVDDGRTWNLISRIPFKLDGIAEKLGGKSFDEPAFEILSDSTFLCVMRTGDKSPMYQAFSTDRGNTWSLPEPFTPNGVKPKLLRLNNGVLVLVSGRPGVQIRFSLDGTGRNWTDAIDMMSFMKPDGSYNLWSTCGYASIIEADKNSFYIVYSDFTTRNAKGQTRKTIWCRRVMVKM